MKVFDEISVAIAANTTNNNVLAGRRYERMPFPGFVTLLSTGSAAGLEEELNIAGQSVSPRAIVNANNRSPIVPDDLRVEDAPGQKGELVQLTVANTTGGALTYRARVVIEEGEFEPDFPI